MDVVYISHDTEVMLEICSWKDTRVRIFLPKDQLIAT